MQRYQEENSWRSNTSEFPNSYLGWKILLSFSFREEDDGTISAAEFSRFISENQ
jgi:hypothetical protein